MMTQNLSGSKRVTRRELAKPREEHLVEARALARLLADDGVEGSAAAGRVWKRFIRDFSDAVDAEHKERQRLWLDTPPEERRQGPGPVSRAFYELGDAMRADEWRTGGNSGHAVDDWVAKYLAEGSEVAARIEKIRQEREEPYE